MIVENTEYQSTLTYTHGSQAGHGYTGLVTRRKQGLRDVRGEGQGHDRRGTRPHDDALHPEAQERQERAERLEDVGVVRTGAHYGGAELGVAVGADHGVDAAQRPDQERHAGAARVDENPSGAHEDAGADDAADDDGHAVHQAQLLLQDDPVVLLHGHGLPVLGGPVGLCGAPLAVKQFLLGGHFVALCVGVRHLW